MSFFAGQHTGVYSLNYRPTCRLEARQVLIYQCILDLTGENGKYNYSKAAHLYPPLSYSPCSAKNYKIASALTPISRVEKIDTIRQLLTQAEKKEEVLEPPKPHRTGKVAPTVLLPEIPMAQRHDFQITDDAIGVGTPSERFNRNVAAIRLLNVNAI